MAQISQATLQLPNSEQWRVSVKPDWDVLGPFPIHAREQHFLSPAFPLNLSEQIDFNATWPSSYADGGRVGWSTARSDENGALDVTFPSIRWESIRATEGWAGLQHHSVLHTKITVHPPQSPDVAVITGPPRLLIHLLQGSFFAILPSRSSSLDDAYTTKPVVPEWYAGNIYAIGHSSPQTVPLPVPPSDTSPTTYDLFVSGDYEIRLFGDPHHDGGGETPTLSVSLSVEIEPQPSSDQVVRDTSRDVFPDFVDGWAFGSAIGIGIRSLSGWWTIKSVYVLDNDDNSIQFQHVASETRLAPTQTRTISLQILQVLPEHRSELHLHIALESASSSLTILDAVLPIRHRSQWSPDRFPHDGIKASYLYANSMATAFLAVPPIEKNAGPPRPPVLTLHGSGVDIFDHPFLVRSFPRQERSWIILPTGRTSWGLDWHGSSVRDVWGTVDALYNILQRQHDWHPWELARNTRVLVTGHSNGGQGTWYLASRYPDRVVGAVPAAGFIKGQAYVPLTQSRSAHFIDPSLRAILESSSTPDDNDLFLSNLVDTPVLAVHGGDDDNVPVWHTREAVNILKTWNGAANVAYREDPGEPHWYPTVFSNDQVQDFIKSILNNTTGFAPQRAESSSFTLTVAIPAESEELHGWRIWGLVIPGRLARLTVQGRPDAIHVQTRNVRTFSVRYSSVLQASTIIIDGYSVQNWSNNVSDGVVYFTFDQGTWGFSDTAPAIQRSGRLQSILDTSGPLVIVIPTKVPSRVLSVALRLAHDLDLYHKLDSEIIDDEEAIHQLQGNNLGQGNIILFGGPHSQFFEWTLEQKKTSFSVLNKELYLQGRSLDEPSVASLFLHPHPIEESSLMLIIHALDDSALEKAVRLFPIRTGISTPDWIVVGPNSDNIGAGDVRGAGVWGNNWSWNIPVSFF